MALEAPVRAQDGVFLGEDRTLKFTVYQQDETTRQNVTGWSISWVLRQTADAAEATISKRTGVTWTGSMTAGSKSLTLTSGQFSTSDVGRSVVVVGAGPAGDLVSHIESVASATQATLVHAAATTVSSADVHADGVYISDATLGELLVFLDAKDTEDIAPGTYYHTLWRTDPGAVTVLAYGDFTLNDPAER